MRRIGLLATIPLVACASVGDGDVERAAPASSEIVIGDRDLVPVTNDGANIPPRYGALLNAFGRLSVSCTATHLGGGIAVTAGHCFARVEDDCSDVTIEWGLRVDSPPYLASRCTRILAREWNRDRDWAIFEVAPAPRVRVDVDFTTRAAVGTSLTILGHPGGRPLEWSKTCALELRSGLGGGKFSHQCDTERGSSGSSILDDRSLKVVGIHNGGGNSGTYLADTPMAQFLTAEQPEPAAAP